MTARLVVVGAGIAGLACAWAARQNRPDLDVLVLEREPHVGGKARSIRHDDWLFETGPSAFLDGRPELDALIDAAGVRDDVVAADATAKRRFVFHRGVLREIVPHPLGFARSGLLSATGLARVLIEPVIPRGGGAEESVWAFAARRLGRQFAERVISPMTLGVYAGDARRLSLDAVFPRMRALERTRKSLIRGLIARRGRMGGELKSFRRGMQQLPAALARSGGFQVRCDAPVHAIERRDGRWVLGIRGSGEWLDADALVLAGEPWAMAPLVAPLHQGLAAALQSITCPPVSVVALGYALAAAPQIPTGFGALFPRGGGYRMVGNLWESRFLPHRAPDGHLLMRVMYGGSVDEGAGLIPEEALLALARAEVEQLYHIRGVPVFARVHRWARAIPQYELGHLARVAQVERAADGLPSLFLTGNGLRGVSFSDAAVDGIRTGERVARSLA